MPVACPAQYTLVRAVDVTDLADRHDRGALPGGVTYTDAVARAVVLSLAEHPNLNAHITGEQVWIAPAIDLGIGIDAEDGLVVGVLRNAGDLGLAELSATRRAITERVRAGRAGVQELQGSTFTISNLGSLGIDSFTPIINPPEIAILGVGRITDQPAPAESGIIWRKSMTLSLTVDHRGVDGAPAARFLAVVADRLQTRPRCCNRKPGTRGTTTMAGRLQGQGRLHHRGGARSGSQPRHPAGPRGRRHHRGWTCGRRCRT